MIDFIKKKFKPKTPKKYRTVEFNVTNCEYFRLSEQEQNDKLVSDGYYNSSGVSFLERDDNQNNNDINEVEQSSSLPYITTIRFNGIVDYNNLTEIFVPKEDLVIKIFKHFEHVLKDIIEAVVYSEKIKLDRELIGLEESDKRLTTHDYFKKLFVPVNEDVCFFLNNNKYLPIGVDETNLLSKIFLIENINKKSVLSDDIVLIKLFLYCPKLLERDNIHLDFESLIKLVSFCARRNLMIELNDKYQFEQNHPYTFIHSNGLVFENYSDLFVNEIDFDWTIDLLISQDKPIPPKFYHRLADALFQEKAFLLSSPFTEFAKLINNGFSESLTRIRPSENTSDDARNEINEMKISLNQHRQEGK